MRERPINLRDWEVRAILDGRKTMIRRAVKWPSWANPERDWPKLVRSGAIALMDDGRPSKTLTCPFGAPGDLLWVRECWALVDFNACDGMDEDDFTWCTQPGDIAPGGHPVLYRATVPDFFEWNDDPESRWRPSIHMPRWASRLTLRVTDVRVERVQDISEDDARAEGVRADNATVVIDADGKIRKDISHTHRGAFAVAWDAVYGKRDPTTPTSWTANPWVWCVSFERAEVRR